MDFGRCFVIREVVILSQVVKWPRLMALRSVYSIVLNIVPWRKAASSDFVWVEPMMLQDRSGVVVAVLARGNLLFWDKGMFQIPLDLFWVTLMITRPFLTMWTFFWWRLPRSCHHRTFWWKEGVLFWGCQECGRIGLTMISIFCYWGCGRCRLHAYSFRRLLWQWDRWRLVWNICRYGRVLGWYSG